MRSISSRISQSVRIARVNTDVKAISKEMPSSLSARPAACASRAPRSVRSTSVQPVNRFFRFHSLWPCRTRTSVPGEGEEASFMSPVLFGQRDHRSSECLCVAATRAPGPVRSIDFANPPRVHPVAVLGGRWSNRRTTPQSCRFRLANRRAACLYTMVIYTHDRLDQGIRL